MIDLACDLKAIRRYVAPAAHRCRIEVDDLVSETACEILGRVRRQPDLRVPVGAMLRFATDEAIRRVVRGSYWPPRLMAIGEGALDLAAIPDELEEEPLERACVACGDPFVPARQDSHHCPRFACLRRRAAARKRAQVARGGKRVGSIRELDSVARRVKTERDV